MREREREKKKNKISNSLFTTLPYHSPFPLFLWILIFRVQSWRLANIITDQKSSAIRCSKTSIWWDVPRQEPIFYISATLVQVVTPDTDTDEWKEQTNSLPTSSVNNFKILVDMDKLSIIQQKQYYATPPALPLLPTHLICVGLLVL